MIRNMTASDRYFTVELVVYGEDYLPVLLTKIRGVETVPETSDQLVSYLNATDPVTPFGLLVTPKLLRFFRPDSSVPALTLATEDVFRAYDKDFSSARASAFLLGILVQAWISDLETRWQSQSPPASEAIEAIGLLTMLKDITIEREVDFAAHRLHRN